ncbi:MAG: hypothetical protein U5L09_07885 [Bacteroidales bacterium]|nr:hypothetical protein [Bacteroidales bacterium]
MKKLFFSLLLVISIGLVFQSCSKDYNGKKPTNPEKFVDLNVSPAFNFESFQNVQTAIQLTNSRIAGGEIIQIYDAHPNQGGKLMVTGAADQQGLFTMPVRLASRMSEVVVGRLNAFGQNEFVAVPVKGNQISFDFASKNVTQKDVDSFCDCDPNDVLADGFNADLSISSGETKCVIAGRYATYRKKSSIGSGGTLKICGTATAFESTMGIIPDGNITDFAFRECHQIQKVWTSPDSHRKISAL